MSAGPDSLETVKKIVQRDLAECDSEQADAFKRFAVEPYAAPIYRYGTLESLFVVARKGHEVIYWEDVEEGFNVSPIGTDGRILEHRCNQDQLGLALNAWIEGRKRTITIGPAEAID